VPAGPPRGAVYGAAVRARIAAAVDLNDRLARLADERVVVIALDDLADLVAEPGPDPFAPRRTPAEGGLADLAATLVAARRLPRELTVRAVLPQGASSSRVRADVEEALHRRARAGAARCWREGMAVHSMGMRQLPLGIGIALASALVAYASAYFAQDVGNAAVVAVFVVVAAFAITVAWVVSWMVIESAMVDWRPMARQAEAYDLLTRAALEVVHDDAPT